MQSYVDLLISEPGLPFDPRRPGVDDVVELARAIEEKTDTPWHRAAFAAGAIEFINGNSWAIFKAAADPESMLLARIHQLTLRAYDERPDPVGPFSIWTEFVQSLAFEEDAT